MHAFVYLLLVWLFSFSTLHAQQAAWELVRENIAGKIAVDPTNSHIIFVAGGANLDITTDGGQNWTRHSIAISNVNGVLIDVINTRRLWLYGGPFVGVLRSEDGGTTTVRSDTGIAFDHHGYSVAAFALDHKRNILYAGDQSLTGGIHRSFDDGQHWEIASVSILFCPEFFLFDEDSGWVYSGGAQGIFSSKDSGTSWRQLQPEVLDRKFIRFLVRVPKSRTLYAAEASGEIYKSYDLGENWNQISKIALKTFDVLTGGFIVSHTDTNTFYVGSSAANFPSNTGGFFYSSNAGVSWQEYNVGLPESTVTKLVWSLVQSNDNYLYMSLRGVVNNVYRLQGKILTSIRQRPETSPSTLQMLQNYPNPFNSQTKIQVLIPRRDQVMLEVLDLNGSQIMRLSHGEMRPGSHEFVWTGRNPEGGETASGVYLIRLQAGTESIIRKMVLIR